MKTVKIEWSEQFALGIEDIDFQHRYFLNLINRLGAELAGPESHEYRPDLIAELNAYAKFHFLSEENMMRRDGYPLLTEHREHHLRLIDELSHRQALLMMSNSDGDAAGILTFLTDWFLNHTVQEDRLFADYLRARGEGRSSSGRG